MKEKVPRTYKHDPVRIATQQHRIQRAQQRAKKYIKPGISIVDEFLAERRKSAKKEY